MPGSGIITESLPKPSQKASNKWIGRADDASRQCRESELLFPFYRSSYRSGSSYDRFKATDGNKSRTNEASLIEMLLATSGMDVGHDYEVKRFTDVRSNFHFLSEPSSDSAAFFPAWVTCVAHLFWYNVSDRRIAGVRLFEVQNRSSIRLYTASSRD